MEIFYLENIVLCKEKTEPWKKKFFCYHIYLDKLSKWYFKSLAYQNHHEADMWSPHFITYIGFVFQYKIKFGKWLHQIMNEYDFASGSD